MIRIGVKAPRFRIPSVIKGMPGYAASSQFKDRWVVLCFVPHLGMIEASFLDRQTDSPHFAEGATLLAVNPDEKTLLQPWIGHIGPYASFCRQTLCIDFIVPTGRTQQRQRLAAEVL